MSWRKNISENIADILKFLGHGFLILDAIVLAAFSFWFICRFTWQLAHWLQRILFSNPW
jgi:hypothetical protein